MSKLGKAGFLISVQEVLDNLGDDEEVCHVELDKLCWRVLREHGHGEAVDLIEAAPKWYA